MAFYREQIQFQGTGKRGFGRWAKKQFNRAERRLWRDKKKVMWRRQYRGYLD